MNADTLDLLEGVLGRFTQLSAILVLVAARDDTNIGTALRGIAEFMDDTVDSLDTAMAPIRLAGRQP